MSQSPFEMRFDPLTIKHLGLRMYSTLPPALAEIISNSYDADATNVIIQLIEDAGAPIEIRVEDDGIGLSYEEINNKFLVIGRDRRLAEGDEPSAKYKRLPTGKKGLGKLALFGLAGTITVQTRKDGKLNEFVLDWNDLEAAGDSYHPRATRVNHETDLSDGTTLTLTGLKRKSSFDPTGLADSLSRIFVFDETFQVAIVTPDGDRIAINNKRRYATLKAEFRWSVKSPLLVPEESPYCGKLDGQLLTAKKPIAPASGLRGITLFSRGKLVNAPEFFSNSTSSHFFQYLTGWISVDFIDKLDEDVIATNRQSLDWEHEELAKLREFLSGIVSQVNGDWRKKRKEQKEKELEDKTGIDTNAWLSTMPESVRENTQRIIESLGGEDALEQYTPVIKALHEIVPEYPLLHWRHLHERLRERIKSYYENKQYGDAASQGVQIYCEIIRELTKRSDDGMDLVNGVFGSKPFDEPPELKLNDLSTESLRGIQMGQGHLSRGIVSGFRNPISHGPIDTMVPSVFSELDCLNILSLVSYLLTRLDGAMHNPKRSL